MSLSDDIMRAGMMQHQIASSFKEDQDEVRKDEEKALSGELGIVNKTDEKFEKKKEGSIL